MIPEAKHSSETFFQNQECYELNSRLTKCLDCKEKGKKKGRSKGKSTSNQTNCQFIQFRKLKCNSDGKLEADGFGNPQQDPNKNDLEEWQVDPIHAPNTMTLEQAHYILNSISKDFVKLYNEETKLSRPYDDNILWKRSVVDQREMCDNCNTTLFNYHWKCTDCGFAICPDCHQEKNKKEW